MSTEIILRRPGTTAGPALQVDVRAVSDALELSDYEALVTKEGFVKLAPIGGGSNPFDIDVTGQWNGLAPATLVVPGRQGSVGLHTPAPYNVRLSRLRGARTSDWKSMFDFVVGGLPAPRAQASKWLDEVLEDFSDTSATAPAPPTIEARAATQYIARLCASLGLKEPTIELDDEGNVEFFIRTPTHGLLFLVKREGLLQVFGSSEGESWRARYQIAGGTWRAHLPMFLVPLARQ